MAESSEFEHIIDGDGPTARPTGRWTPGTTAEPTSPMGRTPGRESRMSHQATMSDIGLFGKEVLPEIQKW